MRRSKDKCVWYLDLSKWYVPQGIGKSAAGRVHSTLGIPGPPPPVCDDLDGGPGDCGGDVDDGDCGDDVDGGDDVYGDQPHSSHPLANSEDSPRPTSPLDSEPDNVTFMASGEEGWLPE